MKIALCLSGGIKYPFLSLKSIKEGIFPNEDIKIFIHTWNVSNKNDYYETVHGLEYKEKENTLLTDFNFLSEYNYQSLLIENFCEHKCKFDKLFESLSFPEYRRNDIGPLSMWYSIYKSNQLKKHYEIENNMIFDCVIRMRFDSNFDEKILNVSELICENNFFEESTVYIPFGSRFSSRPFLEDWYDGINDQFALGSSNSMDVYSNIFNEISNLQDLCFSPELILKNYLERKSITCNRFEFFISINNNVDFRNALYFL